MFKNKIRLLVAGCVIIVGLFCMLQFLLIMKTYRLEKEKYVSELRQVIIEQLGASVEDLHSNAVASLIYIVRNHPGLSKNDLAAIRLQIASDNIGQRLALSSAIRKVPQLNSTHYNLSYLRILLFRSNGIDTLLSENQPHLVVAGEYIAQKSQLLISNGVQSTTFDYGKADSKDSTCRLEIRIGQYVDIADWQSQVLKRMSTTFFLGAGLIILIVFLLYGIVATLIRQKKIADMKTDFANNITHELKTPLTTAGIIIKTLGILEVAENKELFHKQLSSLERQHDKITKTVDWVLESAMTDPLPISVVKINVWSWLNDLVVNLNAYPHELQIEGDKDKQITSDEMTLASILRNLLDNAIKYSKRRTTIVIRFYTYEGAFVLEVENKGDTISRQYRPYLFDKFYRIPEKKDTHFVKGLGLGLYLSRKNAVALGGELKYHPIPEGNCFQLIIPNDEV
jgi:two-component system phosphate regulon sensor histidine kinase PhoR